MTRKVSSKDKREPRDNVETQREGTEIRKFRLIEETEVELVEVKYPRLGQIHRSSAFPGSLKRSDRHKKKAAQADRRSKTKLDSETTIL